ncbi:MAG: DegT/DnrJ/EryC1/StrS family aminotransferase [Candidatus Yanofskybacteria bacterium]|nr:DegT/DnrJ/EryC1/StrS family aminotransferase [Candidatus Yanofskybacteria bacterium]
MNIPLSAPDITDKERKAVLEVLKTPFLSLGPKQKEFEELATSIAGRKYAVAVNSGTSGLHLIVRALGIKKGDEVITSPFSFIASSNCILFEGAKPVFADIEEKTLGIDPVKIEQAITKKTRAILAVDVFGHPAQWDEILRIAKKHKLRVIEDSAEAIGSTYKGKPCGSFGDAAIFSFYPNKQVTTGEGGVVLTDSSEIADQCRSMANQGRKVQGGKWLEHVQLGYNYRLSDIQCALGIAQLKRLHEIMQKRAKVAGFYKKHLARIPEVQIPHVDSSASMSWFVYVIRLSETFSRKDRDRVISKLASKGVQARGYFEAIHLQPFYQNVLKTSSGQYPVAESVSARSIALPFYNKLTEKQVEYVADSLRSALK